MHIAKRTVLTLLCLLLSVVTARADLKMTVHMEAKADPNAAPGNPMMAAAAGMMRSMIPEGGVDVMSTVGEKGARTEYSQAAFGLPEGTISFVLANGDIVALNPKDRTYWKVAVQDMDAMMKQSGMQPVVTTKLLDEYETVAGIRARHMTFDWKVALPIPEAMRSQLPPGMPTEITMSGDIWFAEDKFQNYAAMSSKGASSFLSTMGLDKLVGQAVVLKHVARSNGMEITGVVTSISEEDVAAATYEIPEGFKEVPPPAPIK